MQARLFAQHAAYRSKAQASQNLVHLDALPEEDSIWPHHDVTFPTKLANSFKARLTSFKAHTTALPSIVAESYRSLARSFTATSFAATRDLHRKAIALAEQQSRTLRSASVRARASIARLASEAGSVASISVSDAAAVLGSSVQQAVKGRKAAVLWGRSQLIAALEGSARAAVHASASSKAAASGIGAASSAAASKIKVVASQLSGKGVAGAKALASRIGSRAQTLSTTMQSQGQRLAAGFRSQAQTLLHRTNSRAQELGEALKARLAVSQRAAQEGVRSGWRSIALLVKEGVKWMEIRQGLRPELRALRSWFQGAQGPVADLAARLPQRALKIVKALHLGAIL